MLGPLAIRRDGRALALPASRKVRALFAYLALAPVAGRRGASSASCCGTSRTIRAASCAGA